jgi:N-acetyl-gamma-glutamyl-phosphate reductase
VEAGCRVVDLSADFRFRDTAVYEAWYKGPHAAADLAAGAVYGMPELHRDAIRSAIVVGNPGCYTTAAILALAPLVVSRRSRVPGRRSEREPLVELDSIVIDAKSGVSGAGRSKFGLAYHFSEVNESVAPYGVGGKHRHTPEIEQELSALAGAELRVSFTPHLVPITRGIVATCYARLAEPVEAEELLALYREFFRDEPFVNVCDGIPASKHAVGSNLLHIGLAVDERTRRVTAVGALDNLGKGMVGQAVQNMNILLGIDETTGLTMPGLWP